MTDETSAPFVFAPMWDVGTWGQERGDRNVGTDIGAWLIRSRAACLSLTSTAPLNPYPNLHALGTEVLVQAMQPSTRIPVPSPRECGGSAFIH